jgi:ATP-dependent Clp protease protease subunit
MNRPFAKAHDIANKFRAAAGKKPSLFAKASEEKGQLYVYEAIGYDWWTGGGITGKSVADALTQMKGVKTLDIFINSEGGDVFEAKAIFAQLKRFDAEKTVYVDGIAASAATFIAMAGDKIVTAPAATWMVHDVWSLAMGNSGDMRSMADLLDLESNAIAETYAARTGKTAADMRDLMLKETWMSAKDALEQGFTDEIATYGDDEADAGDESTAAAAKVSPILKAAALTQERLRAGRTSVADSMRARVEARSTTTNRSGQPETQRTAGQPRGATNPAGK